MAHTPFLDALLSCETTPLHPESLKLFLPDVDPELARQSQVPNAICFDLDRTERAPLLLGIASSRLPYI